jgi:hypothetical protein
MGSCGGCPERHSQTVKIDVGAECKPEGRSILAIFSIAERGQSCVGASHIRKSQLTKLGPLAVKPAFAEQRPAQWPHGASTNVFNQ